MPSASQTDTSTQIHPATGIPQQRQISAARSPNPDKNPTPIPTPVIRDSGLVLNEVIPSQAKESIFFNGYLDSPANRSLRS